MLAEGTWFGDPTLKGNAVFTGLEKGVKDSEISKAKCNFYEPLSSTEGNCNLSENPNTVSINAGCNNPKDCQIYKLYIEKQNKK